MIKRDSLFIFFILFLTILTPILFLGESYSKCLFISISLIFLIILTLINKKPVLSSLLYILLILPFNITLQLNITDPYVGGVYVNYLVPTISILDVGIVVLLVASLVELGYRKIIEIFKKYIVLLILFFIFLLIQNIFLKDYLALFNSARLLTYLGALIVGINYLKEEINSYFCRGVFYIILFVVLLQGILGILQFSRGSSLGLDFLGESQVVSGMQGSSFVTLNHELFLRAYGTFPHPNILGGFLLVCTILLLFIQRCLTKTEKIISFILISFICICIFFTFSRICIILLGVILLLFFSKDFFKKRIHSFSASFFIERFFNLFAGLDSSIEDRINLIKVSLKVIRENILIGTGIGNFVRGMKEYIPRTVNGIQLLQPVHSIPLLWMSEMGILGSFLYIALIVEILRKNIKKITIFSVLVFLCLISISLFDHYLFSLPQGMVIGGIFFILLCIVQ